MEDSNNVLVSKVGKGDRLHMVGDDLMKTFCGLELDALEHKTKSVSILSKGICISCRCARCDEDKNNAK